MSSLIFTFITFMSLCHTILAQQSGSPNSNRDRTSHPTSSTESTATSYSSPTFIILAVIVPTIVMIYFGVKSIRYLVALCGAKHDISSLSEGQPQAGVQQHIIEMISQQPEGIPPVAIAHLPIEPKDVEAGGRIGEPSVIRQEQETEPGCEQVIEGVAPEPCVITTIPSHPLPRSRIEV